MKSLLSRIVEPRRRSTRHVRAESPEWWQAVYETVVELRMEGVRGAPAEGAAPRLADAR